MEIRPSSYPVDVVFYHMVLDWDLSTWRIQNWNFMKQCGILGRIGLNAYFSVIPSPRQPSKVSTLTWARK